jgi:hypothetical protein|tara:strand:+ start:453 stop:608 length:156 start_codon:yes stop_codon:yes gene_type:complete
MRIKGATTILEKQCEFLGMTWDQLIEFMECSPMAQPVKVLEAYKVYKKESL